MKQLDLQLIGIKFLSGDEVEDITNYQIEYFIDK